MKKFIILLFFICILSNFAIAGDYNWAKDVNNTNTLSSGYSHDGGSGSDSNAGTTADVVDENTSTFASKTCTQTSGPRQAPWSWIKIVIQFPSAISINSIKGVFNLSYSGSFLGGGTYYSCGYYDGSWHWLDAHNVTTSATGQTLEVIINGWGTTTKEFTSLNLTGITQVCLFAQCAANSFGTISVTSKLLELYVYGPTLYDDIGLRIKTASGIKKIGVQTLDNNVHKLRVRKGNTTYGIPLVSTADSDASPIRIYDGSSIKSLPKTD